MDPFTHLWSNSYLPQPSQLCPTFQVEASGVWPAQAVSPCVRRRAFETSKLVLSVKSAQLCSICKRYGRCRGGSQGFESTVAARRLDDGCPNQMIRRLVIRYLEAILQWNTEGEKSRMNRFAGRVWSRLGVIVGRRNEESLAAQARLT